MTGGVENRQDLRKRSKFRVPIAKWGGIRPSDSARGPNTDYGITLVAIDWVGDRWAADDTLCRTYLLQIRKACRSPSNVQSGHCELNANELCKRAVLFVIEWIEN